MGGPDHDRQAVTLYRFFAADDSLLYVGVTRTGLQRVRGHASKARWWPHAARAKFEHGRTLDDERAAIELERPVFNVEHTDRADWLDTFHDAVAAGWATDAAELDRRFMATYELRDRLLAQVAECDRRLDLLTEASRINRRRPTRQRRAHEEPGTDEIAATATAPEATGDDRHEAASP